MKLVLVTSNKKKAEEVRHILGRDIDVVKVDMPEIQSLSAKENARYKAYNAYRIINKPLIVEDTGLYIKGFEGFPGALVKWYVNGVGCEGVCRAVDSCKTREVYAETSIAYYDGKVMKSFEGRAFGYISKKPARRNGFGWDCIFIPKGHSKEFSRMTLEEKSKISHRGKSMKKLIAFLESKDRR